jgi:hypothetical protein
VNYLYCAYCALCQLSICYLFIVICYLFIVICYLFFIICCLSICALSFIYFVFNFSFTLLFDFCSPSILLLSLFIVHGSKEKNSILILDCIPGILMLRTSSSMRVKKHHTADLFPTRLLTSEDECKWF